MCPIGSLPIQLQANDLAKAAEDGSSTGVPAARMRDLDEELIFFLPNSGQCNYLGVSQDLGDLCLYFSIYIPLSYIYTYIYFF